MDLSEFCRKDVVRNGEIAEIIFDYFGGNPARPVRLIGFQADANLPDYEILEQGYWYYLDLMEVVGKG